MVKILVAALALAFAPPLYAGRQSNNFCQETRPLANLIFFPDPSMGGLSPVYLPASVEEQELIPGVRLNVRWTRVERGLFDFRVFFDFDTALVSNDFSVFRLYLSILDGERIMEEYSLDYSDDCKFSSGHSLRAGETFNAAKFSTSLSKYAHPRVRVRVWGGMF